MTLPVQIAEKIATFQANREQYRASGYNETQVRREFIDPMFKALGWDVENESGMAEPFKDVIHEDKIKIGETTRAPDYCFRVGGRRKFYVEAKKPAVNVKESVGSAFQLRRYSWTAKLPIGILTDFEEFAVYDCRIEPKKDDAASVGRLSYMTVDELEARWPELVSLFSKTSVEAGSLEAYAVSAPTRGVIEVDRAFLREIESWRELLADDLARGNLGLDIRQLNFAIQRTIDRVVFLRICEDRGIEPYGRLRSLLSKANIYSSLKRLFDRAEERYNSGLFHFKAEKGRAELPDDISLQLTISNHVLASIIGRLYYPDSPYEFSVLPADILGQVYEQYLGRVVELDDTRRAVVVEKPEVRKAGGVYYTPTFVVDFIVKTTLGEQLRDFTPQKAAKLRVLDPACGSGSFLIEAYQFLLDSHLAWYLTHDAKKFSRGKNATICPTEHGAWKLTVHERKRILLNSIFGVDIDPQAVEVTKLSLLLKVLEEESNETLHQQMSLFHERALSDLVANIKCGNSLVGPDFFSADIPELLGSEARYRINAFDWDSEFPLTAKGGFDTIIGNPPYLNIRLLGQMHGEEVNAYFRERYRCARKAYDMYILFIEKSLRLLRHGGKFGMIVPNKIATLDYAFETRKLLTEATSIDAITDLSDMNVFADASVYPYIICCSQGAPASAHEVRVGKAVSTTTLLRDASAGRVRQNQIDPEQGFMIHGSLSVESAVETIPLGEIASLFSGTTGFSAERIAMELREKDATPANADVFQFIVSGSIDRYSVETGDVRYMKRLFRMPVLPSQSVALSENKKVLFSGEKIVVSGMTKRIEAAWDPGGLALGVQVYAIRDITCDPFYLLGLLNSKLLSYLFRLRFQAKHLAGGYLAINKGQLEKLPIRRVAATDASATDLSRKIGAIAKSITDLTALRRKPGTQHERTAIDRQIAAHDRSLDRLVYQLYKVGESDIERVERSIAEYA